MPIQPKEQPPYYNKSTYNQQKIYIVSGTQTGTSPPVYIEHINTIGIITSVRYGAGSYGLESNALFKQNKTWINGLSATDGSRAILIPIGPGNSASHFLQMQWESEDEIFLDFFIAAGANVEWNTILGTFFLPKITVFT